MTIDINKMKDKLYAICLAIPLIAIPLANLIRAVSGRAISNIAEILMALSLVGLYCSTDNSLFRLKIERNNFWLLCYLIILTGASLLAGKYSGAGGAIYNIYAVCLLLILAGAERKLDEDFFLSFLFYFSGICSVFCLYVFTDNFTDFSSHINTVYSSSNEILADRLSLSNMPVISVISSLAYRSKRKFDPSFKIIFIIVSLFDLVIFGRRGKLAIVLVITLFFIVYSAGKPKGNFSINRSISGKIVAVIITITVAFFILRSIPSFYSGLVDLWESLVNAVSTMLSGGTDASARSRYNLRNEIFSEYGSYSVFEVLFGKGYMYRYLDFPLLQIFIDTGIVGGLIYCIPQLVFPAKCIFRKDLNEFQKFTNYLLVMGIINLFFSGIPYGWDKFIYIIIALTVAYKPKFEYGIVCNTIEEP